MLLLKSNNNYKGGIKMNVQLLGPKALTKAINMRAIASAVNLERKAQENPTDNLNETISFDDLFGVQYTADPRGMEIRKYLTNKNTAFIPENLQYILNKNLEYADIDHYEV